MNEITRCDWAGNDPLYIEYHDRQWGRPVHDDGTLFEMLILEGMQAGLSWITILRKREAFREAFDGFDAGKVMGYGEEKLASLLTNPGIIRNRLKLRAAVQNAKAFRAAQEEFGSFDAYLWGYVGGRPIQNRWASVRETPAATELSGRISRDLKKRGFQFVGSTIVYAYMQAVGMVNDHVTGCFVHEELAGGS